MKNHNNFDHFHLLNFGASRTKTQEFYSTNNLNGTSQRLRTNFLPTTFHTPKYPSTQTNINSTIKEVYPENFSPSLKLRDKSNLEPPPKKNLTQK
jgi:hypothetical protein